MFIVKVFIVKVFIVKVFIVKVFIVKVFIVKVFIVKAMDHVRSQKSDSTHCYITTINCDSTFYNTQIKSKIDDSSHRLNFEECRKIKIYRHSSNKRRKMSKNTKFACEML